MTRPSSSSAHRVGPGVIFDLESLLLDPAAGVRHALTCLARACGADPARIPMAKALHGLKLDDVLAKLADTREERVIAQMAEQYWHFYEAESRYLAPLRAGASDLLTTLSDIGAELHYVSTLGPQASVRLVNAHGLNTALKSIYTPPIAICAGARAGLLERFVQNLQCPLADCLVLGDGGTELYAAQRLGIPALAIGYGRTSLALLESLPGLLGIALSPQEVSGWLRAGQLARRSLDGSVQRDSARLH